MKMIVSAATLLALAVSASALPTATDVQKKMGFGINIGNTMEVPISSSCSSISCWGNGMPTKVFIDSVAKAGFSTVRIPTAWYTHSKNGVIDSSWMDSVKTVVDYCIADNLYVVLNSHWDSGWLEDNVFAGSHSVSNDSTVTTDSAKVHALQTGFWTQIATKFKDYDEHLLFAGANEPGVNDAWLSSGQVAFDAARMGILKVYEQAFIDAVRATGGNNATRTLIVQAPRTDEALAHTLLKGNMPTDPTGTGYLMAEFHFYPYQFSLMTQDASWGNCFYYWGNGNYSTTDTAHNAIKGAYASPEYVDSVFAMLKSDFVDQGIPLVIGEYAAIKRASVLSGDNLRLHLQSRVAFYHKVDSLSNAYGFVPLAWDVGGEGTDDNTIIRRQSEPVGSIMDYEVLNAMRRSYGLDTIAGNSIDSLVNFSNDTSNRSLYVTYKSSDTSTSGTVRFTPSITNWASYKGLVIRAKVSGSTGMTTGGSYGWKSVDFAVMSGSGWKWTDSHFSTIDSSWADYSFTLSTSASDTQDASKSKQKLYVATPSLVDACVINLYSLAFTGSMMVDYVALVKTDGTLDTIANFNKALPATEGNIDTAKLITTPAAAYKVASIRSIKSSLTAPGLYVSTASGMLSATFRAEQSGMADVTLLNPLGQVIGRRSFMAATGTNSITFNTKYRGVVLVQVRQNGSVLSAKTVQH